MSGSIALALVESQLADPQSAFTSVRQWLLSPEALAMRIDEVEIEEKRRVREVARLLLDEHVRARGPGDVGQAIEVVETNATIPSVDGGGPLASIRQILPLSLSHRRKREVDYVSQFGAIAVDRMTYGRPGYECLAPLDEQLGLPARSYSYPVQQMIATGVARGPYAEAAKNLIESTGLHVATANIDAVVRDVAVDFDDFYSTCVPPPSAVTGPILVAAVDGKGVPIRQAPRSPPKSKRLKPGEKPGRKNEARVAAVYTIQPHERSIEDILREHRRSPVKLVGQRPRPEFKRVWARLEKTKDQTFQAVGEEMMRRDPDRSKTWVVVVDGDLALLRRAMSILGKLNPRLIVILDLYHVLEYLWKAAHAFCGEQGKSAESWVTDRLRMLLSGQVSDVARGMRQSATKLGLKGSKRAAVDQAADYFLRRKKFMRYDQYVAAGLPIGSGAAEGACRNLICDRLERTGMSWTRLNAEAVLKLRALELSGDTADYWKFHINREQERIYGEREWAVKSSH